MFAPSINVDLAKLQQEEEVEPATRKKAAPKTAKPRARKGDAGAGDSAKKS